MLKESTVESKFKINHNRVNLIKFANFINKRKFNLNYEQENRWAQIILAKNYKGHFSADIRAHFSAGLIHSAVFSIAHFSENVQG